MSKKIKKITSFSLMIMAIASTIGAGIFFKNKTLMQMAQGDLAIVLITWGVSIIGMIALALALVEVTSAQKTNQGTLEWVKLFCPRWFYQSSTNYAKWIFIPITLFTIPVYVTNSLEDAGLPLGDREIYALLFSFGIFIWFMLINTISLRFVEVSQWIFTIIQMIPLLIFPIIGFVHSGENINGSIWNKDIAGVGGLTGSSPWLAVIAGISAIAFAFDGFYTVASLRNEMHKPRKVCLSLVGGVLGISSIYLFLTIGINLASNGGADDLQVFLPVGVYKLLICFISFGIMGVANGYAMSSIRQFRDLAANDEAKEIVWLQKIIYRKRYQKNNLKQLFKSSWLFILLTTTFLYSTLGLIGSFAYDQNTYGDNYAGANLYSLIDVITNFTSLLAFAIIATAILGALINRKTQKVIVEKNKFFVPAAFIAIIINYASAIYMIIDAIVGTTGYNNANPKTNIVNLSVFVSFLLISVSVPVISSINRKVKLKMQKQIS